MGQPGEARLVDDDHSCAASGSAAAIAAPRASTRAVTATSADRERRVARQPGVQQAEPERDRTGHLPLHRLACGPGHLEERAQAAEGLVVEVGLERARRASGPARRAQMRPSVTVTPARPATACPSIDSHGDRIGSDGIAGRPGMPRRRQLGGRAGVDVGQAADGSGEPHTEFDCNVRPPKTVPPACYVGESRRSCANLRRCILTDRLVMWAARGLWALLPVLVVASFAAGLDDAQRRGATVRCAIGLWVGWAVVLGALFVPNTVTLTIVRIVVPASIVARRARRVTGGFDDRDGLALAATDRGDRAVLPARGRSGVPARRRLRRRGARRAARARQSSFSGPIELVVGRAVVAARRPARFCSPRVNGSPVRR